MSAIVGHRYELPFKFALQTGLRCGELNGLRWSDIDWEKRKIHIQRTMEYRHGQWRTGEPKTANGNRKIPLTAEALRILEEQKRKNAELKVIPMKWSECVFLNDQGKPVKNGTYDTNLSNICKRNNIDKISMHSLRHTFATRCIEAGMMPKTLQTILGHSKISITMDLYVHTTDDEKQKEMEMVSNALLVVG